MKYFLIFLLMFTSLLASSDKPKLYYNKKPSQENIDITYKSGLFYASQMLGSMIRKQITKRELLLECNESLYYAIFKNTVIEKAKVFNGKNIFIKDCKNIANKLIKREKNEE